MKMDMADKHIPHIESKPEKTRYPKACIMILNWNGLQDTVECLESLRKITYPNYQIIVVDNASVGNDTEVLKEKYGNYIRLIENDKNYGFAEGNNIGMRYALGSEAPPDYFLLLNNDTVVAPDFLTELVKIAETNARIGIVGPMIYIKDSNNVIWSAGGKVYWWRVPFYYHLGYAHLDSPKYQTIKKVDFVSGAAMMLKRGVVEQISFLNSHYFFGYEEIECCIKARRLGYEIEYVPTAKIWHKELKKYKTGYDPSTADPAPYFYLIKNNFPLPVYFYHLMLFPILLFQWGITYLKRYRDWETLRKFFSDFSRFIVRK